MCGFTGFFSPAREIDARPYYDAHLTIRHRGPDDEGFTALVGSDLVELRGDDTIEHFRELPSVRTVTTTRLMLGHRRLSIIDLTYHGHEPFADRSGRYRLVFNGEVYNYVELREELRALGHDFVGDSDTEVLLEAYAEWGTDAFSRFNGMWSVAIFDSVGNDLVLCRDRFGIKPLFYCEIDGALYFSSETKFLRALLGDGLALNASAAKDYVERCILNASADTFWSGVEELPPAHWMRFSGERREAGEYWTFRPSTQRRSLADAVEEFGSILDDSLRLRMRSDVEVGTLLSGGLDSTLIVCELDRLGFISDGNFKSFSAVFHDERFSEKRYIDETVSRVPVRPFFVYPDPDQLVDYVDRILWHVEEPFRSLSLYSQFLIYQTIQAESRVTVVLNGQGGDELFGGYSYHYPWLFGSLIKRGRLGQSLREMELLRESRGTRWPGMLWDGLKNAVHAVSVPGYFNERTFAELKESALREYLTYDDRTSMAFGVEARVPLLDYRMVEFAFSLDEELKIHDFANKRVPREFARGVIPDAVLNRKDKAGFPSPQEIWQRTQLAPLLIGAREQVHEVLAHVMEPTLAARYASLYDGYVAGSNETWDVAWRCWCLARWMQLNGVG